MSEYHVMELALPGIALPGIARPGVAIALLAGVPLVGLVAMFLARRARPFTRVLLAAYAAWTAAILVVTLSPGRVSYHPGVCAFFWSGTASDLGSTDGKVLNILVFVPLGLLAGLLVRSSWLPLAGAAALSPAIELVQREVPSLRRACDLVDVIDNVGGLVVGAAAGVILVGVTRLVVPRELSARRDR